MCNAHDFTQKKTAIIKSNLLDLSDYLSVPKTNFFSKLQIDKALFVASKPTCS